MRSSIRASRKIPREIHSSVAFRGGIGYSNSRYLVRDGSRPQEPTLESHLNILPVEFRSDAQLNDGLQT